MEPCEQYQCLNPLFYCSKTLYTSGIQPKDIKTAQAIVREYVSQQLKRKGEVGLSGKTGEPYHWYQVNFVFDDGSQNGFEVGPDGAIYEIKRLN